MNSKLKSNFDVAPPMCCTQISAKISTARLTTANLHITFAREQETFNGDPLFRFATRTDLSTLPSILQVHSKAGELHLTCFSLRLKEAGSFIKLSQILRRTISLRKKQTDAKVIFQEINRSKNA